MRFSTMSAALGAGAMMCAFSGAGFAQGDITASLLPAARTIAVGSPATIYATVANSGDAAAVSCAPSILNTVDASLSYQTADQSGALTGAADTPVDIAADGTQNFLLAITPNSSMEEEKVIIDFNCDDGVRADFFRGVTVLTLSAQTAKPDIIATASTISGDGVLRLSGPNSRGRMALAAINIGAGDPEPPAPGVSGIQANEAAITVYPEFSELDLPVALDICAADSSGVCTGARGDSVTVDIGDSAAYFAVRAVGQGYGSPLFADIGRIDIVFEDSSGIERGRTSVALDVGGPEYDPQIDTLPEGVWSYAITGDALAFGEIIQGQLVIDADGGMTAFGDRDSLLDRVGQYGFQGLAVGDTELLPDPAVDAGVNEAIDGVVNASPGPFTATWRPGDFIAGRYTPPALGAKEEIGAPSIDASTRRRIRAIIDDVTDDEVTLAGLADDYGVVLVGGDGVLSEAGDVTIDALGGMSGTLTDASDDDCAVSAALAQPDIAANIFTLSVTATGDCDFAGEFSGHLFREDGELQAAVSNGLSSCGSSSARPSLQLDASRSGRISCGY